MACSQTWADTTEQWQHASQHDKHCSYNYFWPSICKHVSSLLYPFIPMLYQFIQRAAAQGPLRIPTSCIILQARMWRCTAWCGCAFTTTTTTTTDNANSKNNDDNSNNNNTTNTNNTKHTNNTGETVDRPLTTRQIPWSRWCWWPFRCHPPSKAKGQTPKP